MRLKLGIVPKLALVFVLFAAFLLVGVGWFTYSRGQAIVQREVTSELFSVAEEKQAALNAWVGDRQADIATLAASPEVIANLEALTAAAPGSAEAQSAHDRLVDILALHTDVSHEYLALFVLDPTSGRVLVATQPAEEGRFKENRPYFVNGKLGPYTQNVYYSLALRAPAMTSAAPVRLGDGRLLGVLAGRLKLDELNAIISRRTGLRQSDDTYVVNMESLLITQPRFISDPAVLQRGIQTAAVQACLARADGTIIDQDYRDVPTVVVYKWLPERELCLIVKLDLAEALAPASALGQAIFVIAIVALLAASALAIALARTITRPILELRAGAARFGAGEFGIRLPETSVDELGQLAGEFNRMAAAVSEKEAKLREHADQLTEANKELEAFSYSVSHDLRAPLRAIDGFSRILLEDYGPSLDDEAQRYLNIVRANTQKMGHLIDDLLAFARLSRQALTLSLIQPDDIVRQALASLRADQEGRQVEITIGALPACLGDPALLTQVFVNLLSNALKYTRRRPVAQIEISCQVGPEEYVYYVKDNGAGFDMRYAGNLFGVFQRLHRAEEFEGTGVGLAIVQRIVARHGGRIWAEAAVDQGATFFVALPAIQEAQPTPVELPMDAIVQRMSELV